MSQMGTKTLFGQWLNSRKRMTYTQYTELPVAQKLEIQKEYRTGKAPKPQTEMEVPVEN